MTTQEVASRLGVDDSYIRRLCINGRIEATKIGRDWVITEDALAEFEKTRKPKKRPT